MAKKALLDVLEQTIGKYVRNLDAESLNVAVWSGKIELNSLQLDCDSVNAEISRQAAEAPNLAVPFHVISGEFEHFEVDVPWAALMSRSVVLRAKGLKIEVEPFNHTATADYLQALYESEAARARKVEEQREQSLELADKYRIQANTLRDLAAQDLESNLNPSSAKSSNNESSTFATRLVRRIIENVQIEISNVKVVVKGSDCAAGVTLDSLSLVTTDREGKVTFVDRTASADNSFLYKNLRMIGLGIYLDEDKGALTRLSTIAEDNRDVSMDHSYVLAPFSFEASLRQADSNNCVEYPKYLFESELRSISVQLSKPQLESANRIVEQMRPSFDIATPLFPEYRPLQRVTKETVVIWWKYATRCVGRLNGRRCWVEFFHAFQRRKQYIELYKRQAYHAKCSWINQLLPTEMDQLRLIEMDRSVSVDGIMGWRNIADAQARKEQEKHDANQAKAKGSIFSSLFGSSTVDSKGADEAPIKLTTEELKALESLSEMNIQDSELSSDSRLCDLRFVLGSFRVDLSSYGQQPLVLLEMGTVSTIFDANQDGSYTFDLALTSLDVHDRFTLNTFFPTVLTNQLSDGTKEVGKVLSVTCSKSKKGDQRIRMKLKTIEAIASPSLLIQLKEFISLSKHRPPPTKTTKANPLLAQSLSGSVDLFYDAAEGSDRVDDNIGKPHKNQDGPGSDVIDDLSNTLIDAWRMKEVSQASWIIDLDLQAPIVVIPESCTAPRGNILVCDLGNFKLKYGKVDDECAKVVAWYKTNRTQDGRNLIQVEYGSVRISSLTFSIGKVSYWRRMVKKHESQSAVNDDEAIVEPISLAVDFGVESAVHQSPRLCAIGILPTISLRLSPSQLSKIISVLNSWKTTMKQVIPESEDVLVESTNITSAGPFQLSNDVSKSVTPSTATSLEQKELRSLFYAEFKLQKLSIKVMDDADNGIEANLISVNVSSISYDDGSSKSTLSMGWFWIMDHFDNDFPRQQRLLAHSALPVIMDSSSDTSLDIFAALQRLGVFNDDFEKSIGLAEITLHQTARGENFGEKDPYVMPKLDDGSYAVSSKVEAHFSRLFINWNPRAVKIVLSMAGRFVDLISAIDVDTEDIIISSPSQLARMRRNSIDKTHPATDQKSFPATIIINAYMDGIQISLHSALDDLPLFTGTMASTSLSAVVGSDDNTQVSIAVDDLRIDSAAIGRTNPGYRTIFGLASGRSDGILSIRYSAGRRAMALLPTKINTDISDCEAFGEITLSPMRMVYIQAQVLALVEYATEGILGVVTAKVVASAAQAAAELATSTDAKKKFVVRAGGFELLLPQAAYKSQYFSASVGSLFIDFSTMPDSSAEAAISIDELLLGDMLTETLLQDPIKMDLTVALKPENVGTKDDQAIRVNIAISKACFVVSKSQYNQILATLDENVGEQDLCLRDSSIYADSPSSLLDEDMKSITHAGTLLVDNPRRIYVNAVIGSLSLMLCEVDQYDPLIRLSAADTIIELKLLSDCGKTVTSVTFRDLSCDDERLKSLSRQHRSLIYQTKRHGKVEVTDKVFFASYESDNNGTSSAVLKIGSPRIVLIPDIMSDVLKFLRVVRKETAADAVVMKESADNVTYRDVVAIDSNDQNNFGIEATFVKEREAIRTSSFSLTLKTSQCSLLLVDLGSESLLQKNGLSLSVGSISETLVLGGIFDFNASIETDAATDSLVKASMELHADSIEVYTAFGRDLAGAVQILDPTKLSLYISFSSLVGQSEALDCRCAAISPIHATLSMRNIALLNAIMTSLVDCLEDPVSVDVDQLHSLNEQETTRLEHLARALESDSVSTEHQLSDISINDLAERKNEIDEPVSVSLSESTFKLTTPECAFTLVNDLQGLDDALIRISFHNIVANGIMKTGVRNSTNGKPFTGFDLNFHTSVVSDYFDSSKNAWKVLLVKPWELSAKGNRGTSRRFESDRPSTTIDIDSFPCHLSFSEQFLMSLASANRMWSIYSAASDSALGSLDQLSQKSVSIRRSMAASAARTFVSALPYAVENHCGQEIQFSTTASDDSRRKCGNGSVQYFNFEPPVSGGASGGKRLYGQDVVVEKELYLFLGSKEIRLDHLDKLISQPKSLHKIGAQGAIAVEVVKEGKTVVVHVSSGIDVFNHTSIPFDISVYKDNEPHDVGTCEGSIFRPRGDQIDSKHTHNPKTYRLSRRFGIPMGLVAPFRSDFEEKNDAMIALTFAPKIDSGHDDWELIGGTKLRMNGSTLARYVTQSNTERFQITCRPVFRKGQYSADAPRDVFSFVFQVEVSMVLLEGIHPIIDIVIEPRAMIVNKLPIRLAVTTPMPHVFSFSHGDLICGGDTDHLIDENDQIEVFSSGPSIAVIMKIADSPIGGTTSESISGGWTDLPLIPEFRMREPIDCVFPFVQKTLDPSFSSGSRGMEFSIVQGSNTLANLLSSSRSLNGNDANDSSVEVSGPVSVEEDWLNFFVTVRNFGVDHTGDVLFEQIKVSIEPSVRQSTNSQSIRASNTILQSPPIGAYSSKLHQGRVSLLPHGEAMIRLLHLNMEGDDGLRKSLPFRIDDVSICDGGIDSTAVKWEDGTLSGFFAYRQLVTSYQSEIHIIPEYIIFNGSKHYTLCVRQPSGVEYMVKAGGVAALRRRSSETAVIRLEYPDIAAFTNPLRIDSLGLRVAILKSRDGVIGSVAVQNVVGDRNSRLVVKIGEIVSGSSNETQSKRTSPYDMLLDDYFRFRVKWSELKMTLYEARPMREGGHAFVENALDHIKKVSTPIDERKVVNRNTPSKSETWVEARERYMLNREENNPADSENAVCTIQFLRFTVDWQRVFKTDNSEEVVARSDRDLIASPERSQFAVVIHSVQIRNETVGTAFPIVFDSTSEHVSFFDLCIRFRGRSNVELVTIDLLDLNLSHVNGVSEKMYLNTDEDFVWKVLDLADSIVVAAAEFAGVDVQMDWDEENEGYTVKIRERNDARVEETKYTPPKSDTIYHIKKTRISPFKIVVSFKRNPQSTRYKLHRGVKGANVMNYFTRRLKFKIDKAELAFAQYDVNDVKGPPDRFIELVSNVYMARMKTKVVTIMTASSFQDWKSLASREGGDDAYVEGDVLRATGNVAGTTVDYVLKSAGQGIGTGVSTAASTIGNTIEAATTAIGVRGLGAGVNSVVTGVGDGVGDTISGVGTGAGKVLKSVGQGAGQAFGGMAGGVMLVGKGLGKGITQGDGRAVATGLMQGGAAVGTGVGQGIESVVTGTAQGVLNVGQGLFSGAKNVGKGFGGAFLEWCSCCSCCIDGEEANHSGALLSPLLPAARPSNDEE